MEGGYRFTAELLRSRPVTGIIYRSLPGAIGGMRAIHEAGLRVPDDVSLMTEGEFGGLEEYLVPPVTTVVCSYRSMLGAAFDAILNPSRRHERQIVIDVEIVERKSVRTLRPGVPAGPNQKRSKGHE